MRRLLLCLLALGTVLPGVARAEFGAVTRPFTGGIEIRDFHADAGRWVAAGYVFDASSPHRLAISTDRGQSWSITDYPGHDWNLDITGGPDGSLWTGGWIGSSIDEGGLLHRFAAGSTTPAMVRYPGFGLGEGEDFRYRTSAPAWDAGGRMWVAVIHERDGNPSLHLLRLAGDTVAERITAATGKGGRPQVTSMGGSIFVNDGSSSWQLTDGTLLPVPRVPQWMDGSQAIAARGEVSWDGGTSYGLETLGSVRPVHGETDLLASRTSLLRRRPSGFFATGLAVPSSTLPLWKVGDDLIAVGDDDTVHVHSGAVPGVPPASNRQIARVNTLRAAAGLAPVREVAELNAAAAGHVAYWRLSGYSGHDQTEGAAGFTGARPGDRCRAAGYATGCGEVAYPWRSADAVDGWIATPYHGAPLVEPRATMMGGADEDGVGAVINIGPSAGISLAPAPYPLGQYDGDLVFHGESPDPVADCKAAGQQIEWPVGATVFLAPVSGGTAEVLSLAKASGGGPLPGCRLKGMFLPEEGLAPHTTYRATGQWRTAASAPAQTIEWEFTTGDAKPALSGGQTSGEGTVGGGSTGGGSTGGGSTGTAPPPPTWSFPQDPPVPAPSLGFGVLAPESPRIGAFARRGLSLRTRCSVPCTVRITVALDAAAARRLKLGRAGVVIARGATGRPARTAIVRAVAKRSLRRKLARQRRLPIRVIVEATTSAGETAVLSRTLTLRR